MIQISGLKYFQLKMADSEFEVFGRSKLPFETRDDLVFHAQIKSSDVSRYHSVVS